MTRASADRCSSEQNLYRLGWNAGAFQEPALTCKLCGKEIEEDTNPRGAAQVRVGQEPEPGRKLGIGRGKAYQGGAHIGVITPSWSSVAVAV